MTAQIVDPEEILNQSTPSPFELQDHHEDWDAWEASPDLIQGFPCYKVGQDLDGLSGTQKRFPEANPASAAVKRIRILLFLQFTS